MSLGPTSTDWLPALTSVDTYQAAVARLTTQVRGYRTRLHALQAQHRRDVAALEVQLREGLTPELIALRKTVSQWRSRALAAEARLKESKRTHGQR